MSADFLLKQFPTFITRPGFPSTALDILLRLFPREVVTKIYTRMYLYTYVCCILYKTKSYKIKVLTADRHGATVEDFKIISKRENNSYSIEFDIFIL